LPVTTEWSKERVAPPSELGLHHNFVCTDAFQEIEIFYNYFRLLVVGQRPTGLFRHRPHFGQQERECRNTVPTRYLETPFLGQTHFCTTNLRIW